MANRRMISKSIVDTDYFLEMPQSARLLYYELNWRADDDGFVDKPKSIMKMAGCSLDDYTILKAKRYIIEFESGVCVIRHWFIHNQIRTDRYTETKYLVEKSTLTQQKTEAGKYYELCNEECGMTERQQNSPNTIPNTNTKPSTINILNVNNKENKEEIYKEENKESNNAEILIKRKRVLNQELLEFVEECFNKTWEFVPNKKDKVFGKNTYVKKMKACKTEDDVRAKAKYILKKYMESKKEWEDENTELKYIPMFSTWLNRNIEDGVIHEEDL